MRQWIVLWAVFSLGVLSGARGDELPQKVGKLVQQFEPFKKTGTAVTVIQGGKLLLTEGYGLRDRAAGKPVTAHTLFGIASMSKAFNAYLAVSLAPELGISLDAPIRSYYPGFQLKDAAISDAVSLADLLSHRTTLPSHDPLWLLTSYTRAEIFERLRFLEMDPNPAHVFREHYAYNNIATMAGGHVLEELARVPWETLARERIFRPLGMSESLSTVEDFAQDPDRAISYRGDTPIGLATMEPIAPAASIHTNAVDAAKWLFFHLNRGRTETGEQLLSPELMAEQYQPRVKIPSSDTRTLHYGLGWKLETLKEGAKTRKLVYHTGHVNSFSSFIGFLPEQDAAVAVLSNQGGQDYPQELGLKILEVLGEIDHSNFAASGSTVFPADPYQAKPDPGWDLSGTYRHGAYGDLVITSLGTGGWKLALYANAWRARKHTDRAGLYRAIETLQGDRRSFNVQFNRANGILGSLDIQFEAKTPPVRFKRLHF
jgi:CubicO group peptidase (beta-lactamase class C family)